MQKTSLFRFCAVGISALWLLILTGCGARTQPNVLLITLDTTRADYLGCYGSEEVETPVIDSLAAQGTLYEHAYAPAPITLPTHTSIMTGTFPVYHGVRDNNGYYVSEKSTTLAEILLSYGWRTAAFVGAFVLDSQTGLDQGFELYDDNYGSADDKNRHPLLRRFYDERSASDVSRAARSWLDELSGREPFFLWLHYWDPHQPHQAPEPYRTRYYDDPYAAEIAFVDEALGQVIAKLREKGLYDNTYIVLTADHGEGLGEHGENTHALILHDATIRIPLIIRDPASPEERRIQTPVSTVDIVQTVLNRLGIEAPQECQGRPLPFVEPDGPSQREILSETAYGTLSFGWSFIERLTTEPWVFMAAPKPRLYDRQKDPEQEISIAGDDSVVTTELSSALDARREELADGALDSDQRQVSPQVAARLAALGYVASSSGQHELSVDPSLPDPWDMMEVSDLLNEAKNVLDRNSASMANALLDRAETMDPGNPEIAQYQVYAGLKTGDLDRARIGLNRLSDLRPDNVVTELVASQYWAARGEPEKVIRHLQHAIGLDPKNLSSYLVLARTFEDLGRNAEAADAYRMALELDPDDTASLNSLAVIAFKEGRTEEATNLLHECLDIQPYFPAPYLNLAVINHDLGKTDEALKLVERALALRPRYGAAWELKAMLLERMENDEAAEAWRKALRMAADRISAERAAQALERLGVDLGPTSEEH